MGSDKITGPTEGEKIEPTWLDCRDFEWFSNLGSRKLDPKPS